MEEDKEKKGRKIKENYREVCEREKKETREWPIKKEQEREKGRKEAECW